MHQRTPAPLAALPEAVEPAVPAPRNTAWRYGVLLVALAAALALPFFVKNFVVFQITMALIYAIAILGLNLLTGINGQFSLGHSAFFGIGAYATAILMEHAGMPFYATLPAAALACFVFGFLFGLPALRLEGVYLALATFALALAMPQFLKLSFLEHWTGGVQGIVLIKPDAPFGLPINGDRWFYYFTLAVGIALTVAAFNLVNSRSGRALMAIRDNPTAARSMGIDVALYKSLIFGISAAYTGIAGAISAVVVQFVAPDSFTFTLAIGLFVGLVVGGVGWIPGALFGGLFVLFVPHIAETVSKGLAGAVYGAILLLVIYVMPSGMAGLSRLLGEGFRRIGRPAAANPGRESQ